MSPVPFGSPQRQQYSVPASFAKEDVRAAASERTLNLQLLALDARRAFLEAEGQEAKAKIDRQVAKKNKAIASHKEKLILAAIAKTA